MNDKKLFNFFKNHFKKTALKLKKVLGLFFIAVCVLLNFQSPAVANLVTANGILKGDHSNSDHLFHQGMQAYLQSNFQQAYQFWKTAEADNHSKAAFNLGRMWLLGQIPGSLKNEKQALIYFKKSFSLGYLSAQVYIQNSQNQQIEFAAVPENNSLNKLNEDEVFFSDKGIQTNRIGLDQAENDWLKQYPDTSWVIQVFASQEPNLLKQMIRDFSLKGQAKILSERIDSQLWYKLVYGKYASEQLALRAKQSLPDRLKKEKPWVRSVKSIKKSLHQ